MFSRVSQTAALFAAATEAQSFMDAIHDIASGAIENTANDFIYNGLSNLGLTTEDGFEVNSSVVKCTVCSEVTKKVDGYLKDETIYNKMVEYSTDICIKYGLATDPTVVCAGIVPMMAQSVVPVFADYVLTRDRICDEWLGFCARPKIEHLYIEDYTARVLADKPESIQNDDFLNNLYAEIRADPNPRKTIRAVHMSDPHIDFEYTVGAANECDVDYLCCRKENGFPEDPALQAGKFGAYKCDLPHGTLVSMLEHVHTEVKPDMFFWTGDNSAHNVWSNTAEEITNYTINITETVKSVFGNDTTVVYPTQGNHDTWPVNVEDFSQPNINYPINTFKSHWSGWLSDEAIAQFGEYGFYSTPLVLGDGSEPIPGSKVIALNTQACNGDNWYLLGERYDLGGQLAFLEAELAEIEAANGVAIIIQHIQPSHCHYQYGNRFQALMERYQHVVRFGLMGHTHDQYFMLTNSISDPTKNIGLNQIGPSVTTNSWENPGFAIIDIDAETMLITNWEIWALDIEKANAAGVAEWEKVIDYVNDYGMENGISPDGLYDLAERMLNDADLAAQYYWGEQRFAGEKPTSVNQKSMFCGLTSGSVPNAACGGASNKETIDPIRDSATGNFSININWLRSHWFDLIVGNWIEVVNSSNPQE